MVFKRASTGCDACRSQHTKCDGGSPACARCMRRGIVCPGYRHVGGFVFKPHDGDALKLRKRSSPRPATDAAFLSNLQYKQPDRFIAYFFDIYAFAGQDIDTSCGLYEHAAIFLRRALPSSTVVHAAGVLGATTFVLGRHLAGDDVAWYHEIQLNAIRSLHRDVKCRASMLRDDTLMAVLLLDLAEAIIQEHMETKTPLSHQSGALALLRLRGSLNFKTAEARSLYNASRYAILRGNATSAGVTSTLQALDVLAKRLDKVDTPPAVRLLDMLDKINALQCALEAAVAEGASLSHFQEQADKAQASLDAWLTELPANWLPQETSVQTSAQDGASSTVEYYDSMNIAVVYNHWRCACLQMIRVRQVFHQPTFLHPQTPTDTVSRTLDSIFQAVPVFLGLLHGPHYVTQDETTGIWKDISVDSAESLPDRQRFRGDYLGKWFLNDLLERVQQVIGSRDDLLPQLDATPDRLRFLREQTQIISSLSYQPPLEELTRIFRAQV